MDPTARIYPSQRLQEQLYELGVPIDEQDLSSLSTRFGFKLKSFEDMDIDLVALLLISWLKRREITLKTARVWRETARPIVQ